MRQKIRVTMYWTQKLNQSSLVNNSKVFEWKILKHPSHDARYLLTTAIMNVRRKKNFKESYKKYEKVKPGIKWLFFISQHHSQPPLVFTPLEVLSLCLSRKWAVEYKSGFYWHKKIHQSSSTLYENNNDDNNIQPP